MTVALAANLPPPIVLTFAASDPTGGAGLQADILTLASLGCHPLTVVTALTVQDTAGVEGVLPINAEWVADQARALLEDMPVAAFKLGMLGSVEAIAAIAEIISDYPDIPVILDPVLASGRGDQFADEEMIEAMIGLLLPQTTLLTPNSLEARRLVQQICEAEGGSHFEPGLAECAHRLINAGCEYVLVTGTRRGANRSLGSLARQLSRLRLYAGFGHRRPFGQRRRSRRGGHGRTGIHLAHIGCRFSSGHGTIRSRPSVLVAGRG
jgi:hydroxymethylpyrimidine/phosphomethylpyrimidine kinase